MGSLPGGKEDVIGLISV